MAHRTDSLAHDIPLGIGLLGLVVAGIAGYVTRFDPVLPAIAVFCWAPLAFDAVLLPRVRAPRLPASLEVPMGGYVIAGTLTTLPCYAIISGDSLQHSHATMHIASIVLAGITAVAVAWLYLANRDRFAFVRKLVRVPQHPTAIPDGVWGACDGAFAAEVLSVGEDVTGHSNDSVTTEPFTRITHEPTLTRADGTTVAVRLADAATLTMIKFDFTTGDGTATRGQLIDARCGVRVAGVAANGTLIRATDTPLLVFAAGRTTVRRELARLHRRVLVAQLLAIAGVACWIAAIVWQ